MAGAVTVRAEAGIARFMPGQRGELAADLGEGDRVSDVLAKLGIPAQSVALILVNDRVATPETALRPGDALMLLPLIVGG